MNDTSASLLDRLRSNPDAATWQRLVDLYTPLIRRWLQRYKLQDQDQDDLIQEVMAALVAELPKFHYDPQRGSFRGWLRTILANRLRNFWRSRHIRPQASGAENFEQLLEQLEDPQSNLSSIWNDLHDQYVLQRLLEMIQPEFEPNSWKAFSRLVLEGGKPAQVAAELGMSVGAVYIAKSRVMRRLQQEKKGLLE